jgi:hypothetical protein
MSKKKLLYVCPHLSTGGQPQYTYKQIKHFLNDFDIEVCEINNSGGNAYVVQKNRIKALVPLHELHSEREKILDIIKKVQPDIIHFQEIPEFDLPTDVLDKIFVKDRKYFIVATTHGSFTNPEEITYQPDRYVLVSEWSKQRFADADLGVELDLWQYPIEDYTFDKKAAKKQLGFESDWKHVLNVGLFSEGKNQGEIFAIARQLEKYKIKFHFVGNQAMNFESYWGPLMNNKPKNCIVWGERDDVDTFYAASDLFYFSSVLELNPLSIKEALSYKLPCLFRRLHTFLDTYDNNQLVTYIDSDLNKTKRILLETLQPEFNEIPGWFSYQNVYDRMVSTGFDGAVFVELGAWFGKSTNYLASAIRKSGKKINLTSIDTWKGTVDEKLHQNIVGTFNGDIFYEFIDNTMISGNYASIDYIKDTSKNAANNFPNCSIDFMMIDGGHSYEDVKEDMTIWYNKIKPGGVISGDDFGTEHFTGLTRAVEEFFYGQVEQSIWSWLRNKPRIQAIHLMTRPNDPREMVSQASLKQLQKYGIDYKPIVNKVYEGFAPAEHCRRPEHISKDNMPGAIGNGLGWITGRHYGCYLAHKGALEMIDTDNYDYTLIFEADAFIYTGLEEFVNMVHKACFISERDDAYYIGLADNPSMSKTKIDDMFTKTAHNQDLAHAYLIPNRNKQWWLDRIADCEWDVGDLWFNHVFYNHPKPRYTTNKMYSKQAEGYSLLDLTVKTWS